MSSPEYTARLTKWVLSQYPLVENLSIWKATHMHTCIYIQVHRIHTYVHIYKYSLCFFRGTWQTVTWPMNRETEKGMGKGQRAVFIKVLLVRLISGGYLLSPRKAESYSHRVNSITAYSLMACTELTKSLLGVICLKWKYYAPKILDSWVEIIPIETNWSFPLNPPNLTVPLCTENQK